LGCLAAAAPPSFSVQPAESNSNRDVHGVLQCHLPAQAAASQVKEEHGPAAAAAVTAATALLPSSRWAATPLASTRRKRKNNNSSRNGGVTIPGGKRVHGNDGGRDSGSQQEICSQEDGGSQQVKDEADDSQTVDASAAEERQGNGSTRVKSRQLVYPSRSGHRQLGPPNIVGGVNGSLQAASCRPDRTFSLSLPVDALLLLAAALLKHMSSCYLKIQRSYKANIR